MNKPFTLSVEYKHDRYGWAQHQAALLRAGRIAEIDAVNVAEEIDDVGGAEYDKFESALRVLFVHMLKWDFQPRRRSRSWMLTIREQRIRVAKSLRHNPSLKSVLDDVLTDAYQEAVLGAARETDLPLATFPQTCPYDWHAATERPFPWDE
jgi:hypothetical protein